jgi:hypothetical protein
MTNLTPEAVKAALGNLAIPQGKFIACDCEDDNCVHDKHNCAMNELHHYAPDLAREYLRLKEVEKAGKALEVSALHLANFANHPVKAGYKWATYSTEEMEINIGGVCDDIAAFRAAVEGK